MASECLATIHLCRIRVTRLSATGSPTAGPNNVYISDKPMSLAITPVIEAGQDKTLVGGCDCIIAQYRGYDKLKYFTFQLDLGVMEPALIEMLTGAPVLNDNIGEAIGNNWPVQTDCSSAVQPPVAVEAWSDGWSTDRQDAVWPYVHWVWPQSYWQFAPITLQNDFVQPQLTGFSRGNSVWGAMVGGNGPWKDLPAGMAPIGTMGGWHYTSTTPVARCGYQSYTIT